MATMSQSGYVARGNRGTRLLARLIASKMIFHDCRSILASLTSQWERSSKYGPSIDLAQAKPHFARNPVKRDLLKCDLRNARRDGDGRATHAGDGRASR